MNQELIRQLKYVKQCIVNKEMRGNDWEEQQEAVNKLEEVINYLKDEEGKAVEFDSRSARRGSRL